MATGEPSSPVEREFRAPAPDTSRKRFRDITLIELYFLPPNAIGRLGGSETPLESYVWSEDPTIAGAAPTVIEPDVTLEVALDGSIRPYLPGTIRFRDGRHFRPVAPFFELWIHYRTPDGTLHDGPLTREILEDLGASLANLSYVVTAANRKAARRTGDPACVIEARVVVAGSDHHPKPLLASSPRRPSTEPLVDSERPIPLGKFQVLRPTGGNEMGVDLGVLRVRFTPASGRVYGPPSAIDAPAPGTDRVHQIVPPENRILNPRASWTRYDADYARFDNPEPFDTYDGADVDNDLSWGVVDDTCDALIEATLVIAGLRWRASARVLVGPPDFAPDRRPFLSLADDLADRELAPTGAVTEAEQAEVEKEINDLFQRVYETVGLTNLDAIRQRALRENAGQDIPSVPGLPRTDQTSLTAVDRPYALLAIDLPTTSTPRSPLPYSDLARQAHAKLADLDLLVEFLRDSGDRVRRLLRPPYGTFNELAEDPGPTPDPAHRDPRVTRDRVHDMRMPPYMRDSDATALSLTHRQYHQILALIDRLEGQLRQAAAAAGLPTDLELMRRTLAARRAPVTDEAVAAEGIAAEGAPALNLETPIRRRVRAFLERMDRLPDSSPNPEAGRP